MRLSSKFFLRNKLRVLAWTIGLLLATGSIVWLAVGNARALPAPAPRAIENSECMACHSQPNMIYRVGINTVLLTIEDQKYHDSIHGANQLSCTDCHIDITGYPHPDYSSNNRREFQFALYETTRQACVRCHEKQTTDVLNGVHQQTLNVGNHNAAMCADCHNPHYVEPETDLNRQEIPDVCARCHSEIADTYKKSVHGAALIDGNPDVPNCISCHGLHSIKDPRTTEFRNNIPLLCAKCHTNKAIMDKYGISTEVLNTYVADYHGTTVTLFEHNSPALPTNKPVCIDCHGIHNISRPDDPETGIGLKKNLLVRCQRCHPDASANFPDAWMSHYIATPEKFPMVFYVNLFYKFMIPGVIGGMLIFVISDMTRRIIDRRKGASH